jgi:transcriptional regulator with XRE-family HTH domain
MKRFGEKLQRLRHRHGLTTRQLAGQLQTSNAQISRIENGLRQASADLVLKAAELFNVPLEQLMKDELDLDD